MLRVGLNGFARMSTFWSEPFDLNLTSSLDSFPLPFLRLWCDRISSDVAIFVGDSVGKSVWIQTTKYRAYFSIWSVNDNLSVGYSVASITGAVSTGQFFRGDAPVQLG